MQELYEVKFRYTYELFESFNRYSFKRFQKLNMRIVIGEILMVLILVFAIWGKAYYVAGVPVLGMIFFPIYFKFYLNKVVKKEWDSNKAVHDLDVTVKFYENELEQLSEVSSFKITYDKLYKMVDTGEQIGLMLSKSRGIAIPRTSISDEAIEFLKSKNIPV